MPNALTPFQSGAGLPAYLTDLNDQGNIEVRDSIPQLSFRGKVWRIVIAGEETIVNRADGEPSSVVNGVILDYNKARSRAYFDKPYVEGQSAQPACWSHDGIVPHESVPEKQSPTCASCPQSKKGSKVTPDGKLITACAQFKRAAFVPITDTKFTPLLLKMPQTSMWDKDGGEMEQKGYYAFDQYVTSLKKRGINHTANVITKIRFDPRAAYPKLLFQAIDYLPQANVEDIREQLANVDALNVILSVDPAGGEVDTTGEVEEVEAATHKPGIQPAPAAEPQPSAAPAKGNGATPVDDLFNDDDDMPAVITVPPVKPPAPAAKAAPAARPAAPAAKAAAKPAAPAAKAAPKPEVVAAGDAKAKGIADLLSDWDNE